MRKNILVLLSLFITIGSTYSQDTIYFDSIGHSTVKNNSTFFRIIKPLKKGTYRFEDYFGNGKLKMIGISLSKDSLIEHGEFKYYDKNGNYEKIVSYKNSILNGRYKLYYSSGEIKEIGSYKYGKLNGKNIQYFINGNLRRVSYFRDGQYNGKMVYYNDRGVIIGKGQTRDDYWYGKWDKYNNDGSFFTHLYYYDSFKLKEIKIKVNTPNYIWMYYDREVQDNSINYFCRVMNLKSKGKLVIEDGPEITILILKDHGSSNIKSFASQNKFEPLNPKSNENKCLNFNMQDQKIVVDQMYRREFNSDNTDYTEFIVTLLVENKQICLNIISASEKLKMNEAIIIEFVENMKTY